MQSKFSTEFGYCVPVKETYLILSETGYVYVPISSSLRLKKMVKVETRIVME